MQAKYEVSISDGSKVMAKVKDFVVDRETHAQTGQKLHSRGLKTMMMKLFAPGGNDSQEAIFNINVKFKVTKSLTLTSLRRGY